MTVAVVPAKRPSRCCLPENRAVQQLSLPIQLLPSFCSHASVGEELQQWVAKNLVELVTAAWVARSLVGPTPLAGEVAGSWL